MGHCPRCLLRLALVGDSESKEALPSANTNLRYFGDYELLEQVAIGGQGVVFKARQMGLERLVALKLPGLLPGTPPELLERFRREGEVAASLEFPNIVQVYETGDWEGRPYLAMRWVEGEHLGQWIERVRRTVKGKHDGPEAQLQLRIARLMIKVASAVQYAHQHGVLHRDLKPGNILVDHQEEPFVTDFGLAKIIDLEGDLTQTVGILGTPSYLAPELASGGARMSTVLTDVYGLGAILYHLITGRPPVEANSPFDALRQVLDGDPIQPRTVDRSISADLEAICLKALNRSPKLRYSSAGEMAEDLRRFVRHQPVLARPITRRQRLVRWAERNPVAATLSALIIFLALVLLLGTPWALWRISAERYRALQRADEATEQRAKAEANLRHQQVARIEMLFHTDQAVDAMALLGQFYADHPGDIGIATWIANELTHRNFALPLIEPLRHNDRVHLVRFSPDGRRLLTATAENSAQLWDLQLGLRLGPTLQHSAPLANSESFLGGLHPIYAAFSRDGHWVATASIDNTAQVWDAETGQPHGDPMQHPDWATYIVFSPDGKVVATACRDGVVRLWTAQSGRATGRIFKHKDWVNTVEFSADGTKLLTASDDGTAQLWEVASGAALNPESFRHSDWVRVATLSPNGRLVSTASSDGTARIWDAETGAARSRPLPHGAAVNVAQFSPDGRWLATGGFDGAVRIWRVTDGESQCPPLRHRGTVRAIDFSPDGLRIVTASEDRTARVWEVRSGTPLTESLRHDDIVWSACFSPDGMAVATASSDRSALVWDVRPAKALPLLMDLGSKPRTLYWTDHDRQMVTAAGRVLMHDAESGATLTFGGLGVKNPVFVQPLAESPKVFVATAKGATGIYNARSAELLTPAFTNGTPLTAAALSPDERFAATASGDGKVRVWEVATATEIRPPIVHPSGITRVIFSPDGKTLATACRDFGVRILPVQNGMLPALPLAHASWIHDLTFSPDGRQLATASQDGTARLWDPATGLLLYPPLRHRAAVVDVLFSPDGKYLATTSRDGTACVWLSATGQLVGEPVDIGPAILDSAFSPDGRWLALACDDGQVTVWNILSSQPLLANLHHGGQVGVCRFNLNGSRLATGSSDRSVRVWDLVAGSSPPPEWLGDLVSAIAGPTIRIPSRGEKESRKSARALRSRWYLNSTGNSWDRWLDWFLADRATRSVSASRSQTVDALLLERLDLGNLPTRRSLENLVESIWIKPNDGDLYAQAAIVLASPAFADEADRLSTVEHFNRKAQELHADPVRGLWARASYQDLVGDNSGAEASLEQIIRLDSENAYIWMWSAAFFEKIGRFERGAFALSKLIEVGDRLPWWESSRKQFRQMREDYLRRHHLDP